MSKYTELNMYFNNQELCYFQLTIIQLEIGIGISRIGPISVPRVTFDIATSQHRDRIRGDILVQSGHHEDIRVVLSVYQVFPLKLRSHS